MYFNQFRVDPSALLLVSELSEFYDSPDDNSFLISIFKKVNGHKIVATMEMT
jgi:hypothetical protein